MQPVRGLKEVISLEVGGVGAVRVELIVGGAVEVPDWGVVHDVESKGAEDEKINGSVGLLHETRDFGLLREVVVEGDRPEEFLHEEFAREAEKESVEKDEDKIKAALCIVRESGRVRGGVGGERIGEEDAGVERVRGSGVEGVTPNGYEHYEEGIHCKICGLAWWVSFIGLLDSNDEANKRELNIHHVFRYDNSRYQMKKFPVSSSCRLDNFRLRCFDATLC